MARRVSVLSALLLAVALVAGGCGDEGEGDAEPDAATVPAEAAEPGDEPAAGDRGDDDGEAPAVGPGADVPAEAEDYCRRSFEAAERSEPGFDPTIEEVRAYYEQLADDVRFLADAAPPEIAEASAYVAEVFTEAAAIVAEADYDLSVAAPLLSEFADDPERSDAMEAAILELERYDAEVCGLTF